MRRPNRCASTATSRSAHGCPRTHLGMVSRATYGYATRINVPNASSPNGTTAWMLAAWAWAWVSAFTAARNDATAPPGSDGFGLRCRPGPPCPPSRPGRPDPSGGPGPQAPPTASVRPGRPRRAWRERHPGRSRHRGRRHVKRGRRAVPARQAEFHAVQEHCQHRAQLAAPLLRLLDQRQVGHEEQQGGKTQCQQGRYLDADAKPEQLEERADGAHRDQPHDGAAHLGAQVGLQASVQHRKVRADLTAVPQQPPGFDQAARNPPDPLVERHPFSVPRYRGVGRFPALQISLNRAKRRARRE